MIGECRVVLWQVMQEYQETLIGLLAKFDRYLRRAIPKNRRIPGKLELTRTLNFQILAGMHDDTPIFFLQIKSKAPAHEGVQLDIDEFGLTWPHPASEAVRIEPHVEDLFGRCGQQSR